MFPFFSFFSGTGGAKFSKKIRILDETLLLFLFRVNDPLCYWVIAAFPNKATGISTSHLLTTYYFRLRYCKIGPFSLLGAMARAGYTQVVVIQRVYERTRSART